MDTSVLNQNSKGLSSKKQDVVSNKSEENKPINSSSSLEVKKADALAASSHCSKSGVKPPKKESQYENISPSKRLFVNYKGVLLSNQRLVTIFEKYGKVVKAYSCPKKAHGYFNYGFITFKRISDAKTVAQMKKVQEGEHEILIRYATPKNKTITPQALKNKNSKKGKEKENGKKSFAKKGLKNQSVCQVKKVQSSSTLNTASKVDKKPNHAEVAKQSQPPQQKDTVRAPKQRESRGPQNIENSGRGGTNNYANVIRDKNSRIHFKKCAPQVVKDTLSTMSLVLGISRKNCIVERHRKSKLQILQETYNGYKKYQKLYLEIQDEKEP